VKFFGQSTAATRSLARLALRHRIPVVPVFGLPLPGGGWRVMYEPEVAAPETGSPEEQIREFTQRCTDWIERYVRRHPEFWFWLHRRWRPADRLPEPERAAREPALPAASPES
jgi:KDO2-lipid IV(A) lauroyltransferase